jgi:hypothetical protein
MGARRGRQPRGYMIHPAVQHAGRDGAHAGTATAGAGDGSTPCQCAHRGPVSIAAPRCQRRERADVMPTVSRVVAIRRSRLVSACRYEPVMTCSGRWRPRRVLTVHQPQRLAAVGLWRDRWRRDSSNEDRLHGPLIRVSNATSFIAQHVATSTRPAPPAGARQQCARRRQRADKAATLPTIPAANRMRPYPTSLSVLKASRPWCTHRPTTSWDRRAAGIFETVPLPRFVNATTTSWRDVVDDNCAGNC